jgi:hypothetical protein
MSLAIRSLHEIKMTIVLYRLTLTPQCSQHLVFLGTEHTHHPSITYDVRAFPGDQGRRPARTTHGFQAVAPA